MAIYFKELTTSEGRVIRISASNKIGYSLYPATGGVITDHNGLINKIVFEDAYHAIAGGFAWISLENTSMESMFEGMGNGQAGPVETGFINAIDGTYHDAGWGIVQLFNYKTCTNTKTMFKDCNFKAKTDRGTWLLTEIEVQNSIDAESMFENCNIDTFNLRLLFAEGAQELILKAMFKACRSLTTFNFDIISGQGKTLTFTEMFMSCAALLNCSVNLNCGEDNMPTVEATRMFSLCTMLQTIYNSGVSFDLNEENAFGMFMSCNMLMGENGTIFSSTKSSGLMAKLDRPWQEGYLSSVAGTGNPRWGNILGNIDSQLDLVAALALKFNTANFEYVEEDDSLNIIL